MNTQPRPIDVPYLPESPSRYVDVALAVVAGLAAAIAGSLLAAPVLAGLESAGMAASEVDSIALAVSLVSQAAGTIALVWWVSVDHGSRSWAADFGLRVRAADWRWLFAGLGLQVVAALAIAPVVQLFAPEDAPRQTVVVAAQEASGVLLRIVLLVLIVAVAATVEEIVFRGMLLARLRRAMQPWPAVLVSSAAFALLHFILDPDAVLAVPGLFVIGIGLGWAALHTGDLSAPIFIHAGVNLTGAVVLLFGQDLGLGLVLPAVWPP